MPHFECQNCHGDSPVAGALLASGDDIKRVAQSALAALNYQGLSMDLAVRGVCADCAVPAGGKPA